MRRGTCGICFNSDGNNTHVAYEMMFGTRDEFTYLECAACGALQLLDPPERMEDYYPSDYYSFGIKPETWSEDSGPKAVLRRLRNRAYLATWPAGVNLVDRIAAYPQLRSFTELRPSFASRILDVGCGAGHLLRDIRQLGFDRVLGIDPFLSNDIKYKNGLEIRRCNLENLDGPWDVIMFHHSFEHMPNPLGTLEMVARMLSLRGCCLIRVPLAAWAWRTYNVNWVELEAPRHYFLYTARSLSLLGGLAGLRLIKVVYDSNEFEVWGSELYKRGIPLSAVRMGGIEKFFSSSEIREFKQTVTRLNRCGQGGRAAFYLEKNQSKACSPVPKNRTNEVSSI